MFHRNVKYISAFEDCKIREIYLFILVAPAGLVNLNLIINSTSISIIILCRLIFHTTGRDFVDSTQPRLKRETILAFGIIATYKKSLR
jgi:hypothetical protein